MLSHGTARPARMATPIDGTRWGARTARALQCTPSRLTASSGLPSPLAADLHAVRRAFAGPPRRPWVMTLLQDRVAAGCDDRLDGLGHCLYVW